MYMVAACRQQWRPSVLGVASCSQSRMLVSRRIHLLAGLAYEGQTLSTAQRLTYSDVQKPKRTRAPASSVSKQVLVDTASISKKASWSRRRRLRKQKQSQAWVRQSSFWARVLQRSVRPQLQSGGWKARPEREHCETRKQSLSWVRANQLLGRVVQRSGRLQLQKERWQRS